MKVSGNIVSFALTISALMLHVSEARSHLRRALEDAGDDAYADEDADAATDDASSSNSYSSYNGYNGRGQYWSSSLQTYDDDGMTEFQVDNSSSKLNMFGSFGVGEYFMLIGLLILVGISAFSYLALKNGFNVIHLWQVYAPAVFGHKDQSTTSEPPLEEAESSEPTGDFVKIENVETC